MASRPYSTPAGPGEGHRCTAAERAATFIAEARAAQERGVLAQQVIDVDGGLDRGVLLQLADLADGGATAVEHHAQVVAAQQAGSVAEHGIAGDTHAERRGRPWGACGSRPEGRP